MNKKHYIEKISNLEEKADIVEEVLLDLPEWFGLPESTQSYIDESRELLLWRAVEEDKTIGFITLKETSESTCEIHCMGIKKEYHRKGIGRKLQQAFESFARGKYKYVQVKTVDEGHYENYDRTVSFYKKVGFSKLEVFPEMWDEWNPCLIMVKKLERNS